MTERSAEKGHSRLNDVAAPRTVVAQVRSCDELAGRPGGDRNRRLVRRSHNYGPPRPPGAREGAFRHRERRARGPTRRSMFLTETRFEGVPRE